MQNVGILDKLNKHVFENLIYFKDVKEDLKKQFANLGADEYLCFDTESCRDIIMSNEDRERVWCWSLSNTINDTVVYGYTLLDFLEFIKSIYRFKDFSFTKKSKNKFINLKIWVHNLGWDFEFLKYCIDELEFKYLSKIMYDDGSIEEETYDGDSWSVVENNGQVYNSTVNLKMPDLCFGKNTYKVFIKMKFYDSHKLVPQKLDTIGKKIIKIDEMFYKLGDNFDYEYIRPYNYVLKDSEKAYIYNDVYILKEFIKQYYIFNNLNGYTASSIAFNNMLNFMFPDEPKKYEAFTELYPALRDRKIIEIVDKSYTGGYTNVNPIHKSKTITKLGHSIDRNSSYPSAMMFNKMPIGMPKYFKGKYKNNKKFDIAFQRVHFDGFKRKNNSPIGFIQIGKCENFMQDIKGLGYQKNSYVATNFDKNNDLITSNYNLVFTIDELRMLESCYDFYTFREVNGKILKGNKNLIKGIKYVDGCMFQSKIGHLGEFIEDCTERKIRYKNEKNECGKMVAKTDMNSVYGKLGSGFERIIYDYVKDKEGHFKHQRKYSSEYEFDYEEKRKYYRPYASFTTSYGRIALISIILDIEKKHGHENFIYSDTDSIYATLTVEELRNLGIDMHSTRLGAWDIETEFYKIKCLGAKKYILYGHEYDEKEENPINRLFPHCAGLPKEEQHKLTFDNFYIGAEYEKKQKRKVIGGYRLEKTTFKLQEFSFYI